MEQKTIEQLEKELEEKDEEFNQAMKELEKN
jgi:hypothetical protein